jgi:hypothetical protein
VGIECFYLYDNNSTDGIHQVLCSYLTLGLVNYTFWPGRGVQLPVYQYALHALRQISFWVAFLDCDEFMVPITTKSVSAFLRPFEGDGGLTISWLVYSSGGQVNRTKGLVIERFRDFTPPSFLWNHIVKSIVNPRLAVKMACHEASFIPGHESRDTAGHLNLRWVPWERRIPHHENMRINHYWTKSYEEFLNKIARGRGPVSIMRNQNEWLPLSRPFGRNDTIMEPYAVSVKKNLLLRSTCDGKS